MSRKRTIAAACLLLAFSTFILHRAPVKAEAVAPPKTMARPRIFVTPATLPVVKERYKAFSDMREKLHESCDGSIRENFTLNTRGADYFGGYAFLYMVTGDGKYLDKVDWFFARLKATPVHDDFTTPIFLRHASIAFDWAYADLTLEKRREWAAVILDMVDYTEKLWRHSDYSNHFTIKNCNLIFPALALYGAGFDDARAEKLWATAVDNLANHAIKAADVEAAGDGGHCEGFGYAQWGWTPPLARACEAYYIATGADLMKNSSYFKTYATWNMYCRLPHDETLARAEDCSSELKWGQGTIKSVAELIAARCRDPHAQYIAESIERKYGHFVWEEILWFDPAIKPLGPEKLDRGGLFAGLGHVVTRSGWGSPNDTFAMFQCGGWFAGHQHADNNSFIIYKGGRLAIESGVNDYSSHRANYYSRTIAHNSITVFDPGEKFSGRTWGGERDGSGANDGGQLRVRGAQFVDEAGPGTDRDVGSIVAYENADEFCYALGDATKSYDSGKLALFRRHFLHIRPDLFIIYDIVAAKKPFKTRFVLHSIDEPKIDDNTVAIAHGKGKLDVTFLLPKEVTIEKIGGAGKEFFVDGKNYPPTAGKTDPNAGAWRIETGPARQGTVTVFLTILYARLAGDKTRLTCELDGSSGAEITIGGTVWKVRFATGGKPGGTIEKFRRGAKKPSFKAKLPEKIVRTKKRK